MAKQLPPEVMAMQQTQAGGSPAIPGQPGPGNPGI